MGCPAKKCQHLSDGHGRGRAGYPFLSSLLIAILPKCPFCISAYSSAVVLCSGKTLVSDQADGSSWVIMGLGAFTLLMVLLNFRGKRTWAAAAIILTGFGMILYSAFLSGSPGLYYLGSFLLLAGVWVNASFLYFFRKWAASSRISRRLKSAFKATCAQRPGIRLPLPNVSDPFINH